MSVDLELAKAHLRVNASSEDVLISRYLDTATAWVERFIGQKLKVGSAVDYFDAPGDFLELSTGPLQSVELTAIAYVDADGSDQEIDIDTVTVSDGKVYPPDGGWPAILPNTNITVTYTAGYASTPPELDQAQLLLVGHFYENRGLAAPLDDSPTGCALNALCRPFRTPTLR